MDNMQQQGQPAPTQGGGGGEQSAQKIISMVGGGLTALTKLVAQAPVSDGMKQRFSELLSVYTDSVNQLAQELSGGGGQGQQAPQQGGGMRPVENAGGGVPASPAGVR